MKYLLLVTLLVMEFLSFAKDKASIEIKEDSVFVDGKVYFVFEKVKYLPGTFNYFIKDLSGKKLAFLKFNDYNDPKEISSANPEGRETYYEVTFLESSQKAEIPAYARQIKMAEFIVKQNIVQNGTISKDSELEFILINGTPYSKKREEMNGGNTIIINNNSTPVTRNGINININKSDD